MAALRLKSVFLFSPLVLVALQGCNTPLNPDAGSAPDGGLMDAGTLSDGGTPDGGALADAGPVDAGGQGTGTLSGNSAFVPDSVFSRSGAGLLPDGGPNLSEVNVFLAQTDGGNGATCPNSSDSFGVYVGVLLQGTSGMPLAPGTYPVTPAPGNDGGIWVGIWLVDAGYGNLANTELLALGGSGTVMLSQADTTFSGTFTTTLELRDGGAYGAGPLVGSFSAPLCP